MDLGLLVAALVVGVAGVVVLLVLPNRGAAEAAPARGPASGRRLPHLTGRRRQPMATIGWFSRSLAVDPWKPAPPKAKMPPSEATSQ